MASSRDVAMVASFRDVAMMTSTRNVDVVLPSGVPLLGFLPGV